MISTRRRDANELLGGNRALPSELVRHDAYSDWESTRRGKPEDLRVCKSVKSKRVAGRAQTSSTGHKRWRCGRGTGQKQEMPDIRVNRKPAGREQGETMRERGALERWKTMSGIVGSASGIHRRCIISRRADWPAAQPPESARRNGFADAAGHVRGRPARPMGGSLVGALNPPEHGGLWPPEGSGSQPMRPGDSLTSSRRTTLFLPSHHIPSIASLFLHTLSYHPSPHPSSCLDHHYFPQFHLFRGHQAMDCEFF